MKIDPNVTPKGISLEEIRVIAQGSLANCKETQIVISLLHN